MKVFSIGMIAICLVTMTVGCLPLSSQSVGPDYGTRDERIIITGSSTMAPLVTEIARRYEQQHPGVRIDVQAGGSGKGISDLRTGQADIAMVSRDLDRDERNLSPHRLAADGVCLIVHRSNPIDSLTRQDVIAIYTGQIKSWNAMALDAGSSADEGLRQSNDDMNPFDESITVVHKAEGRATLAVFLQHFGLQNPQIEPDVIAGHNEQAIKTVATTPGAIAYVSIGTAEADRDAGVPIKLLTLDGVTPTDDHVASGEFPISRSLNLVVAPDIESKVASFLQFALSVQVHDIISQQHFVPITD